VEPSRGRASPQAHRTTASTR